MQDSPRFVRFGLDVKQWEANRPSVVAARPSHCGWGGRFYIFIQAFLDTSTNVRRLDPTDGSVTEVVHDSGFRIVGAGVSTCAPVELI